MKVVVNSDILISAALHEGTISRGFAGLCQACHDLGVSVVVPKTALLELNRKRTEYVATEIRSLEGAMAIFQRRGIRHDETDPAIAVQPLGLMDLLAQRGVSAEVFDPTYEILLEAHDRACEHRPPTANKKSDEMRDVVIWLAAVAIARDAGGAILIARDGLFHDPMANDEADGAGLVRVTSVEEAVARLTGATSPAQTFAKLFLQDVLPGLTEGAIDLPPETRAYRVSNPVFTQGDDGRLASVSFGVSVSRVEAPDFTATLEATFDGDRPRSVVLKDVVPTMAEVGGEPITIALDPAVDIEAIATKAGLRETVTFGGAR